ncbi:MAG: flagellar export chaperone FlgN [Bdellovibrio sp.]|nr:flagellar export chaperone FlgN [Bdellovibrio sp.]
MRNVDISIDSETYQDAIAIWHEFCELHFSLFEATAAEYSCLLNSDIEKLEITTAEKNKIITAIDLADAKRQSFILNLQEQYDLNNIASVSDLIIFLEKTAPEPLVKNFIGYNSLLKDLIEKIKEQNKKNQIFLNKAIYHLQELRENATGKKTVHTYNAKGKLAAPAGTK